MNKQIEEILVKARNKFEEIEEVALFNQKKVLTAFRNNKIALRHFNGTSGYGYDDS